MKKSDIFIICGAMFFLTGCPYSSDIQLGRPSVRTFDNAIIGNWTGCDLKNKSDCGRMAIYRFNESEYYVEVTDIEYSGPNRNINIKTDRYRAFMTDIGVAGLLDAQELNISTATPNKHFFVKTEIQKDNTLKLSYMSDEFAKTKFSNSEELAGYIRKNHAEPGFYESFQIFEREKTK
ncbi:MAG: hypothetical protein WCK75_04575 [Elusimicrobiota bacterium]